MKRTLSLKRETLAPLSTDELALVAGGQEIGTLEGCLTGVYPTLPLDHCLDRYIYITPPTEV